MMPEAFGNLKRLGCEQILVDAVQQLLRQNSAKVATAESCTGGILATWLTRAAGSSEIYVGGVSAYANDVKTELLGVDAALIERCGAVSEPVARAMAVGARERLSAAYGLSVTGIAGPGGGTAEKPVGTVFIAAAGPLRTKVAQLALIGDRDSIRYQAAEKALELLRALLMQGSET